MTANYIIVTDKNDKKIWAADTVTQQILNNTEADAPICRWCGKEMVRKLDDSGWMCPDPDPAPVG